MLKSLLLLSLLLSFSSSALIAGDKRRDISSRRQYNDKRDQKDQTRAFKALGISDEDLWMIAQGIFNLSKSLSEEYFLSDSLTMAVYILRYMAEIGEFELVHEDMMSLVDAFEKLQGKEYDEKIYMILNQIRKIQFGRRDGKYFAKIFSQAPRGIVYDINEKDDNPDSGIKEIRYVLIGDGAEFYFNEVDTKEERVELVKWATEKYKFETLGKNLFHEDVPLYIREYFDLETPANALKIHYSGVRVRVITDSILKGITLDFKDGYALPGFRKGEKPIPSFLVRMEDKILKFPKIKVKVKISIDQ